MADNPAPRKPGFFSRLFTARDVEPPPEDSVSNEVLPSADTIQLAHDRGELRTADNVPIPAPEVPSPERKKGLFDWFFKKREQQAATPPADAAPAEPAKKSWFEHLRERLRRGTGSFVSAIRQAVGLSGRLDAETLERIEEILLAADVGMETTLKITDTMKKRAAQEKAEGADAIMALLRQVLSEVFTGNVKPFEVKKVDGPYVVMIVGVNGAGKTTTIGKIAKRCRDAGLKTLVVAGDTFRAAAIEQLEIWAQRTGCELMKSRQGSDASGLAYDALLAAKARNFDVVLIDTAGRLHTKTSLMEELGKMSRVCKKVIPDAPHETLLVLDATTGQNAVNQVKVFSAATEVSGLVMTKLDGTAKGGVLLSIRDQFPIPITLIGVGEGIDNLRDFDPEEFAAALFKE